MLRVGLGEVWARKFASFPNILIYINYLRWSDPLKKLTGDRHDGEHETVRSSSIPRSRDPISERLIRSRRGSGFGVRPSVVEDTSVPKAESRTPS